MAMVPYVGGAVATSAMNGLYGASAPRATRALKEAAKIHAKYGVPFSTGGGKAAFTMAPLNEVRRAGPIVLPRTAARPKARQRTQSLSLSLPPVAVGTTVSSRPPQAGGRSFKITHTALFGSSAGGTAFSASVFRVNPGLPDLFPWLSGLSGSFDMYRIVSMEVRYVPVTGTDTEGAMYIAWDPDPEDPTPTSKVQVMNYANSLTTPVWKPASLKIPSQGTKFVRRGEVVNTTRNTYDNGQLFICQQGAPSGTNGDLYVSYTVELFMPHVSSNNAQLYWEQSIRKSAGSVARATPHGTLPASMYGDIIVDNTTISYPSSGIVRYPLRNVVSYDNGSGTRVWRMLVYLMIHSGTGVAAPTLTCSDANATVTAQEALANAGTTAGFYLSSITWTQAPANNTYIQVDYTTCTTITGLNVWFSTVPDAVTGVYDA